MGFIEKSGSWFTFRDQRLQGKDSVKNYLKENPDMADELEAQVKEAMVRRQQPDRKPAAEATPASRAVSVDAEDFED